MRVLDRSVSSHKRRSIGVMIRNDYISSKAQRCLPIFISTLIRVDILLGWGGGA